MPLLTLSRLLLFLVFVVVFAVSPVSAQTFTTPSQLLSLDSGKTELAPRVHARGTIMYVSWIDEFKTKSGNILFATSTDGGTSFSTPSAVTSSNGVNATLQRSGEFAVDNKGYIHMVWTEMRVDAQHDVFYSRSTDNGATWSAVEDISRDNAKATQDFPDIAADSLGNVYVAWIDNRDRIDGLSEFDHIYFTRSTDNGSTWETPKKADRHKNNEGGSCECCRISVEASPEGKVFIAFRGNITHVRDIWVARSNDRGMTWDETIRVQTKEWIIHACPATGPMATVDKAGNLHVVYRMVDAGKPYIFYNVLPAGASKTFDQMSLTPSTTVNYPDVATTSNGAVYVTYQAGFGGVQYRRSTDGGKTWSDAARLNPGNSMQEYAMFAMVGDSLSIVWQDNVRDKGDMLIAKTLDVTQAVLPAIVDLSREVMSDSVTVTWQDAVAGGMTWYEVVTEDATMIVLSRSITIAREVADRSNVTVTPINSSGGGESLSLIQLSVDATKESARSVFPNPVSSGEMVMLPVESDQAIEWSILDVSGKVVGQTTSHRTFGSYMTYMSHSVTMPQLAEGIYYLTNTHQSFKIVIRK